MAEQISITAPFEALESSWRDVYNSGQFSEGYYVKGLESEVEKQHDMHCVAFNSAGSGLYALSTILNIATWTVPNNTFYATASMFNMGNGSIVDLIDSKRGTPSIGMHSVRKAQDSDGIVMTHVGGHMAEDYMEIADYCKDRNITLIEDAAHVLGASLHGYKPGQLSTAAVYSLYPTKAVPVGEGGLVVTKDKDLAESLRRFRNYGKYLDDGIIKYGVGMNLRMDEWTSVVAYHQLKMLPQILDARRRDAEVLGEIIPTSMRGAEHGNYYKYIVDKKDYDNLRLTRKVGKVYQLSDQIQTIYPEMQRSKARNPMKNSRSFSYTHECLPIGAGMYDAMNLNQVLDFLQEVS